MPSAHMCDGSWARVLLVLRRGLVCRKLVEESEGMRVRHLEHLERVSGVGKSVLDFIETGGIPPSVEALYAWLEYRGIDTAQWGKGSAKHVRELFHEIWSGESEPLTELPQRVISVVKVRAQEAMSAS